VSDEQQQEESEVKVVEAVQTLDELLQDEDAMWTKVSQPQLEEHLDQHDRYVKGILGAKRASLKFLDMSYLDFSGRNLTQADCTGARCEHATMEDANLMASNFYAADMRFVSLIGADLTRADLRGGVSARGRLLQRQFGRG